VKAWADGVLQTRLQEVLVKIAGAWRIDGYHDVDAKAPELHSTRTAASLVDAIDVSR
jgi:hypothetical protein